MISRSVLQTPAMSTRTTASPSLGVGTGMDCSEAESPATTKPCCEQSIGRLAAVGRSEGEEDALCWWAVEKEQHLIARQIREDIRSSAFLVPHVLHPCNFARLAPSRCS